MVRDATLCVAPHHEAEQLRRRPLAFDERPPAAEFGNIARAVDRFRLDQKALHLTPIRQANAADTER